LFNNLISHSYDYISQWFTKKSYLRNKQQQQQQTAKNNQIWNEHQNLNKFSAKQEKRRNSAFKLFRRSNQATPNQTPPSANTVQTVVTGSLNLVDTMSRAVNLVDQTLSNNSLINSALSSITSSPSTSSNLNDSAASSRPFSPNEFANCLTRLVSSSLVSSTSPEANVLFSSNSVNGGSNFEKLSVITAQSSALIEFEEQFRLAFPQLYQDLMKQMKLFVDKFLDAAYRRKETNSPLANNNTKQSEVIQDFYKKIYKYILSSASIRSFLDKLNTFMENSNMNGSFTETSGKTDQNNSAANNSSSNNNNNANESIGDNLYEAIMIMVESFINNSIYDFVFPSIMTEFEEQDMELQKRIRGFYWITNEMIGTCIDENSIFFRDAYEEALNCKNLKYNLEKKN
jgi:hypothetical protein